MCLKEYLGREREVLAGVANGTDEEVDNALHEAGLYGTGAKGRTNEYHSRMDDGWAEMVMSLEGFDYARYGIQV